MRGFVGLVAFGVVVGAVGAYGQAPSAGTTQPRDGLGDAQTNGSFNGLPAGTVNAQTGPQSRPYYPSGSSTPNPGAAFVKTQPVPATGQLAHPPGELSTTTQSGNGTETKTPSPGVGEANRPPSP